MGDDSLTKKKGLEFLSNPLDVLGVPTRSRTAVVGVKGRCPRPLDDGDEPSKLLKGGIYPFTSFLSTEFCNVKTLRAFSGP